MKKGDYTSIKLSKYNLFAMAVAATEIYPKETMGLLTFRKYRKSMIVGTVVPFTSVKRIGTVGVQTTKNSWEVYGWAGEVTNVMDGWHTHPYRNDETLAAWPSKMDIDDLEVGEFEIIMSLKPLKQKGRNAPWHRKKKGLECSMNGFKFRVRAWKKVKEGKAEELLIVLANPCSAVKQHVKGSPKKDPCFFC